MPSKRPRRRLLDIVEACARIRAYVEDGGGAHAVIRASGLHRDAVERQLLIISEAAAKLRGQVDGLAPEIDWDAIRGMGNALRHDYDGVSDDILQDVLDERLGELARAA